MFKKKRFVFNSIRWKLLSMMIGLIVSLLAILSFLQISTQKELLESELGKRISLMKESLLEKGQVALMDTVGQAENSISMGNLSNLVEQLRKMADEREEIFYVILTDEEGLCHVHTFMPLLEDKKLEGAEDRFALSQTESVVHEFTTPFQVSVIEFISPVQVQQEKWGTLRIAFSSEGLKDEINRSRQNISDQMHSMVINSVLTTIGFIVLGAFLVFVISNRLSQPIIRLTNSARELSKGNFTVTRDMPMDTGDELGVLSEAFAQMSQDIKNSYENLETEVKKRTQDLSDALEELKNAQDELVESEKMASLGQLVAGLAHEINTPIGISVTSASFLSVESTNIKELHDGKQLKKSQLDAYVENATKSSDLILKNLQRTSSLVESFKMVSSDQTKYMQREFDLEKYIREVLHSLEPEIKRTKLSVTIENEDTIVMNSYPGAIAQIITNLTINSIKHGFEQDEAGDILIELSSEDKIIYLTYSDNGLGIPEDNLKNIFEPFFTTKRNQGGTGLGLHIVFNTTKQILRGKISCASKVGEGTTFSLQFPHTVS